MQPSEAAAVLYKQAEYYERRIDALTAELAGANGSVSKLRFAMRQAIKNAGGIAEPEVSDEFLILGVPSEMGALKHANITLTAELAEARRAGERYRTVLERNRTGYQNILEMRKLSSPDPRYGALTREEIEAVIAEIDAAMAKDGPA